MSRWTIYSKWKDQAGRAVAKEVVVDGNIDDAGRYALPELEYNGTWMGETFVTLNIRCSEPIDFEIGDYIVYRGEKFVMNYDPSVVKKARRGTYGEGFTYDNVKFNALNYELTDVRMLDYVIGDNGVHYSGLPTFQFFCSTVDDLCDRLQVNADRYCEENGIEETEWWVFVTPSETRTQQRCKTNAIKSRAAALYSTYFGDNMGDTASEKVNQNVSIDNMSVWDACKFIKETFGLNFISRERSIVVGAIGVPTEREFRYGLGNGLYEIERVADEDQAVITKLYAYGSDKNLPTRYYANIGVECYGYVAKWMQGEVKYLLLDIEYSGNYFTQKTTVNGQDCYAVRFTHGGVTYDAYVGSTDVIEGVTLSGFSVLFTDGESLPFDGQEQLTFIGGVNKDAWPTDNTTQIHKVIPQNLPDNMAVSHLMLPGFPSESLYSWVKNNGGTNCNDSTGLATWRGHTAYFSQDEERPYILSQYHTELGIREATKMFDGSDGTNEIYPTIENTEAGVIYAAETIKDNGVGTEMKNFTITLPDFGSDFDLKELLQSDTAIEMTDGYCGGRSFNVKSVKKEDGRWVCTCEREHDTALDLWFPYSYNKSIGGQERADEPYQVRGSSQVEYPETGDRYVLTGIEMTSTYVEAAATVLLEEALKFLEANEYVRYTYVPRVDEIFMARQHDGVSSGDTATYGTRSYHDTLKEGDTLLFADDDLHIRGSVFIDTLHIKEYGNGQIPTYEITLRNDKEVGTIQRLQDQINSISSTVNNGGGGGGGVNIPQIRQLIQTYGGGMFLSKLTNDTANGVISFARGLVSNLKSYFKKGADFGTFTTGQLAGTGANINENGKIEAQALTLREYLEVPELRFNRAEIIAGNTTQTPCGGIIDTVNISSQGDASSPGTGSATLKLEDGEIGKIEVGDYCMGYWHDMSGGNSSADDDDRKGRMTFSGFKTVYFYINGIPNKDDKGQDNTDRHYFRYTLRPQGDDLDTEGGNGIHPFAMMHFAGRGNNLYTDRQGFTIHTPNYTARLSGVNTWQFKNSNYTYVNGDLTGFGSLIDRNLDGQFGTIDMNLYMKGHVIQVDNTPDYIVVSQSNIGLLNKLESQTVTFQILDGYRNDHTSAYTFAIMRDSGDVDADATWDADHTSVTNPWQMSYSDLNADRCVFTVVATRQSDSYRIQEQFVVRKNNNLRYYLTLNTDIIHVDMNGDLLGYESSVDMTRGDVETDGNNQFLQLNSLYLTTENGIRSGIILARAWRVGSGSVVRADLTDGLVIRAYAITGSTIEQGGESTSGELSITHVDRSCDKYIIELIDSSANDLVYDTKTVVIVRDGSASVVADFDDDMGSGAAASDGTILAGLPYTSDGHLYYGSSMETLTNAEIINVNGTTISSAGGATEDADWTLTDISTSSLAGTKYTLTRRSDSAKLIEVSLTYADTTATISLTTLHRDAPDNNKFGVRFTAGSERAVAYFYYNKFKAGSDGHVTLYQLSPDVTAIKINKLGQHSATVVNVGVLKIDVDETGQTETNLTLANSGLICRYALDADITSSSSTTTGTIQCPNIEQKVSLRLEDANNVIWDTETVPVIRDGQDSNYVMKFAQSNIDIWADAEHTQLNPGWVDTFGAGYNWAIMSSDGGVSWNGPYPIVGEQGASGDYTEFSFAISSLDITANAKTKPSDINDDAWSDGVVAVTAEKPYLWMRTGKFVWNATLNNGAGGHELDGDYTYARVKGVDAPDRYELELTDTSFQVDSNGNTFTPSEIKVQAVAVKANGSKDYKETSDYQNSLVRVSMAFIATDDTSTSSTVSYGNLSFDGSTAIRIKQTLINLNKDITALKSVTLTFDFYKNASDSTAIGTATTTIPIMRNGRDGAIVAIADFDDEMVSVPTDSTGKAQVSSGWVWQTTAHLYYGTEQLTLSSTKCSIVGATNNLWYNEYLTISSDGKTATLQVNGFNDMKPSSTVQPNTNNCKITIELVSADESCKGRCTAYVNKIPAGEGGDGKDAVMYSLSLNQNAVHTTADGTVTSGRYISITAYKTKGEDNPVAVGSNVVWIAVYDPSDGTVTSSTSGSVSLDVGTTCNLSYYRVCLYMITSGGIDTSLLIDQETIPVLKDGAKGNKGDAGDSIALEYSPNGTSNWNSTFRAGTDLYAREYKIDANGNRIEGSEGAAFRIVGETGTPGPDGKPGDYTDYSFGRSAQSTTTDSYTEPVIDGSWNDGVPVPSTAYPYIWMRKRLMTWDATQSKYVEVANTTRYIRVTGEKGEDGKDAASYEYVRFSDNATLVGGVWTGTFTAADATQVTNKGNAQGNTKNLIPYSEFEAWDNNDNVPLGWMRNNDSSLVISKMVDEDGVAWAHYEIANGTSGVVGLSQNPYDTENKAAEGYFVPISRNQTYTFTVRYKGSGYVYLGAQYYKYNSGSSPSWTFLEEVGQNNNQKWSSFLAEYADGKEHQLTMTFQCALSGVTHARLFLARFSGNTVGGKYNFAQPMVLKGDQSSALPSYLPAPSEDLLGTTKGLWKGVMRWSHPYASSDFAQYEWNKIRDAEPRMNTWNSDSYVPGASTDLQYYYCGAYGEPYYDMMYDGQYYWICKQTYQRNHQIEVEEDGQTVLKYITPDEPSLWSLYWEMASQFNFLVAKTLYSIHAFIEDLAVKKLNTVSVNGSTVTIQDGLITLAASNTSRFEFGNDSGGNAVLKYIDKDGNELYDLGPNKIMENIQYQSDVWEAKKLVFLSSTSIPRQYLLQNSYIPLNTSNMGVSTYYTLVKEAWKMVGELKQYEHSTGDKSLPSGYEGKTFKSDDVVSTNYIPDGYYRDHVTGSPETSYQVDLKTGNHYMNIYYYSNGAVDTSRSAIIQFTIDEDGRGIVTK